MELLLLSAYCQGLLSCGNLFIIYEKLTDDNKTSVLIIMKKF